MKFTLAIVFFCFWTLSCAQTCLLYVPASPLTAPGLATPYQLGGGSFCNENTSGESVFVEGVILDTSLGKLSVYNPLVITMGTVPLVTPTVPTLPAMNSVGLWFGSEGIFSLTDNNNGNNLQQGNCVDGITGSIFGEFAYCNAVAFFSAANTAINSKILTIPPLGTAVDGLLCPTIRDFFIVDNYPSSGLMTTYIYVGNQTAQNTQANLNSNPTAVTIDQAGDNRLMVIPIYGAMGCTPFYVPDLANPSNTIGVAALALNELQAYFQPAPQALVPISVPMTEVNNAPTSLNKTNVYRVGVGQMQAPNVTSADGFNYCSNLYYLAPKRMLANQAVLFNAQSPDSTATNLLGFLANRYFAFFGINGLNCNAILEVETPIKPITNGQGVATGATITVPVPSTPSSSQRLNVNIFFATFVVILTIIK